MNVVPLPASPHDVIEPDWTAIFTSTESKYKDEAIVASEIWHVAVADMRLAGTLSPSNGETLRRYVFNSVMLRRAETAVAEKSPVVRARKTGAATYNPWWAVLRDAAAMIGVCEDMLGLSPRRRGSVTPAKAKAKPKTAADTYLGTSRS